VFWPAQTNAAGILNAQERTQYGGAVPENCVLFDDQLSFLPRFEGAETLYSWAARYHRLSGNVMASQTSLQLFGDTRAGLRHDFPSHLDRFDRITRGHLGDPAVIAKEKTLLGFFSPFADRNRYCSALNQMRGTSVARLKTDLGLMPSRVGAAHPMKACPDCVSAEFRRLGFALWHIEHQWPSVWICREHEMPLKAFRNEKELKSLRRYVLPDDLQEEEWRTPDWHGSVAKKRLLELAKFSSALICSETLVQYRLEIVRYAALVAAAKRQWVASDGSMRFHQIRDAFRDYYRGLDDVPGFGVLVTTEKEHGGLVGTMLRRYDGIRHPLKQLLLICFFFESPTDFHTSYQAATEEVEAGNVSKFGVPPNLAWRAQLRQLVETEQTSVNQAAKILGVAVPQVIHWANKDGIHYNKRPRVITVKIEKVIRDSAKKGLPQSEIAKSAGVKKSLLRSYLAGDTKLREIWRAARLEAERQDRRSAFLALLEAQRGLRISLLKRIPGNDFSWLRRNDPDWLSRNLPRMAQ
jgi:hypothetical protein